MGMNMCEHVWMGVSIVMGVPLVLTSDWLFPFKLNHPFLGAFHATGLSVWYLLHLGLGKKTTMGSHGFFWNSRIRWIGGTYTWHFFVWPIFLGSNWFRGKKYPQFRLGQKTWIWHAGILAWLRIRECPVILWVLWWYWRVIFRGMTFLMRFLGDEYLLDIDWSWVLWWWRNTLKMAGVLKELKFYK